MTVRRPDAQREKLVLLCDHVAVTADIDVPVWQAPQAFRVLDVRYINPTGLADDPADYASATLESTDGTVAALFDTSTDELVADTFATATIDPDFAVGAAGDELVLALVVVDGGGTPTLPAGRIQVEIEYL